LCHYIAPNLHDQKDYFRTISPIKNWFWGVFGLQLCTGGENKGPFRKPRSGLTWFNVSYCILQCIPCYLDSTLANLLYAGHLDRRFPVLFNSRNVYDCGCHRTAERCLLRRVSLASIRAYLGASLRGCIRVNCNVLPDSVLSPTQGRSR
jgi:hypothetical protein